MRDSFGHYLFELICKRSQNLIASHTFFYCFMQPRFLLLYTLYKQQVHQSCVCFEDLLP
jgi:hypothetical protein